MSEEQMNDSSFGRLFILMILLMSVLAVLLGLLASSAASDVNARLDERSAVENSSAIVNRVAPVGSFAAATAAPAPVVAQALSGEQAYASCAACHAAGIAGAPQIGVAEVWQTRIAKGIDTLYSNAINGYQGEAGYMPAKGGNGALSDDSVRAAVDFMVSKVQ